MSLYKKFATSDAAEKGEGVKLNYGDGIIIRLHRAGGSNRAFNRLLEAKMKPYTRQIATGSMDEEVGRALFIDVYARTVIIGWEGVTGRDGEPIEFTVENVIKVMTDLPELFQDIQRAAQDRSLFLADMQEAVEGN